MRTAGYKRNEEPRDERRRHRTRRKSSLHVNPNQPGTEWTVTEDLQYDAILHTTSPASEYVVSITSAYVRYNTKGVRLTNLAGPRTPNPDYNPRMARYIKHRWPHIVNDYIFNNGLKPNGATKQ